MNLQQWDREVAPYLHMIESAGRQITVLTESVGKAVFVLASRPEWFTKAEQEMECAEREAMAALERIRSARARYRALPILDKPKPVLDPAMPF